MLRLPKFALATPERLDDALALLSEHGERAVLLAGGTDIVPNLKHEIVTPELVISLAGVAELRGICERDDGALAIGALTTLDELVNDPRVAAHAPALVQAAGLISGPQLRRMGTLGGNVMLDTRCQWINQSYFWRQALGFCLKKDGTLCHVVEGGSRCVAAASNDTAPALMTLGATLVFATTRGRRELPIDELWHPDGIYNKKVKGEILVEVRIPRQRSGHRGAYGKLRDRGSIDFPLFGVAARLDVNADGTVADADLVTVALQARPLRVRKIADCLAGIQIGTPAFEAAARRAADIAHAQCHPLANVPGDHDYRRKMVPVYVRRTLLAAANGTGPVHAV